VVAGFRGTRHDGADYIVLYDCFVFSNLPCVIRSRRTLCTCFPLCFCKRCLGIDGYVWTCSLIQVPEAGASVDKWWH
jgi:hypothetical protein